MLLSVIQQHFLFKNSAALLLCIFLLDVAGESAGALSIMARDSPGGAFPLLINSFLTP